MTIAKESCKWVEWISRCPEDILPKYPKTVYTNSGDSKGQHLHIVFQAMNAIFHGSTPWPCQVEPLGAKRQRQGTDEVPEPPEPPEPNLSIAAEARELHVFYPG